MTRLTEQILAPAAGLPEGAPLAAKSLLQLGRRAGEDEALSRLAERGELVRAGSGVYLQPVAGRLGTPAPTVEQAAEALTTQCGEVIVSNGAAAANALGLTAQLPVRSVYLTSGRSRTMNLGKQAVELRHAPRWQLALAGRPAGQAVRALAWLGPKRAEAVLPAMKWKLPPSAFGELAAPRLSYRRGLRNASVRRPMAESFLSPSVGDHRDLLRVTAGPIRLLAKDLWFVWTLATLFGSDLSDHFGFKGGRQ